MIKTKLKGFTLVELIIVIVVISLLMAFVIPKFIGIIKDAYVSLMYQDLDAIEKAVLVCDSKEGEYPFLEKVEISDEVKQTLIDNVGDNGSNVYKIDMDKLKDKYIIKLKFKKDDFYYSKDSDKAIYPKGRTDSNDDTHYIIDGGIKDNNKENNSTVEGFVKNFGGTDYDYLYDVTKTNDGGDIAIGASYSNDLDLLNKHYDTSNYEDAIIVKHDSNGNVEWVNNFGGSKDEEFFSVTETSDGCFVAVGWSSSSDLDLLNKHYESELIAYEDGIIVKYDSNGNMLWSKNFGGSNSDRFERVSATKDGGVIVVGESRSNDYDLLNQNKGSCDALIVKYDKDGNIQWSKTFGGTKNEWFYGVSQINDNGYIVVCKSNSSDLDLLNKNKGAYDGVIVKYDESGNVVWSNNFGGSSNDDFADIIQTNDNGFVVVGSAYSNDLDLLNKNKGAYDGIIVKYDENGNVVWSNNFGGSLNDDLARITQTNDNGFVVVGSTYSNNLDLLDKHYGSTSYSDGIIVKYDSDGNIDWSKNFGGSNRDELYGVDQVKDSGIIIVGHSKSDDLDLLDKNNGYFEGVIIKVDNNGN